MPMVSRERLAEVFVEVAATLVDEFGWQRILFCHAIPLRLRGEVIGALNLFGTDSRILDPDDVQVVQALADIATISLLQERAIRHAEILAESLHRALNSRVVIEQAKGALARIHGIDVDAAFQKLRAYAWHNNADSSTAPTPSSPIPPSIQVLPLQGPSPNGATSMR